MLHLPVLRSGKSYESIDKVELKHHATGEPLALVSQANSGLLVRDVHRMDDTVLEAFSVAELLQRCRKAGELFLNETLPVGEGRQSYDDYITQLSATTGMPVTHCHTNAGKIHRVLVDMDSILSGLTRGFDLDILDKGHGVNHGAMLSYFRAGRIFGAVLPSNSPGVHGLWIPAVALKAPVVLKPGREEPWSPYRIIQALIAAGIPAEAFGFYPTDHGGAAELLRVVDRAMLFGDATTTRAWADDPRVELHGPGYSKVIFGDDQAGDWRNYLDVVESSVAANGGRSCINASAVWTPREGKELATALAKRLAETVALPVDHPDARVAAFANQAMAERMSEVIDHELKHDGAVDLTEELRGTPRLVKQDGVSYLLPTVIWCDDPNHSLVNREFLFPYVSVAECATSEMPERIGSTLVCSAITNDRAFQKALMDAPNIDRLNFGPIPTMKLAWDQPHEGNLFEHLYRQRAFQAEHVA